MNIIYLICENYFALKIAENQRFLKKFKKNEKKVKKTVYMMKRFVL
jgi:hypothetical protein